MKQDGKKMALSEAAAAEAQRAYGATVGEYLDPKTQQSNVVGMGVGVKWRKGQPTGEPALIVLVTQKLERDQLSAADLVPPKLGEMQTDVLAVGYPFAGDSDRLQAGIQTLTKRARPAEGGYSVGHFKITAGTIATCVYDILPGGGVSPPAAGIGMPPRYYILSNNHVLANSNDAALGDPVLQPGPFDGGADPTDRIARLSRFIPITFEPAVPRARHNNLVDAAAQGECDRGDAGTEDRAHDQLHHRPHHRHQRHHRRRLRRRPCGAVPGSNCDHQHVRRRRLGLARDHAGRRRRGSAVRRLIGRHHRQPN